MNNPENPEDLEAERRRIAADIFETNKSAAAGLRDVEKEIAAKGPPPVDLRTVPLAEWGRYEMFHLTLPPAVALFLTGREPAPIGEPEEDSLCNAVAEFHGVRKPWYVDMDEPMRSLGRVWSYVPEVAPMLTGFVLRSEE